MKYNKNRRIILALYLAVSSTALLTGFTSFAAESDQMSLLMRTGEPIYAEWDFGEIPQEIVKCAKRGRYSNSKCRRAESTPSSSTVPVV